VTNPADPPTAAQIRAKNVDRYFAVTPSPLDRTVARRALALGCAVLVGALGLGLAGRLTLGVLAGVLGGALTSYGVAAWIDHRRRFADAEPKPSDEYMDDLLEQMLEKAGQTALRLLGITAADLDLTAAEIRLARPADAPRWLANTGDGPPTVFGPVIDMRKQCIRWRPGSVWRFRSYTVLVLCPTRHRMGLFSCTVDLRTDKITKQELREYFYTDVIAVNQTDKSEDMAMLGLDIDRQVIPIRVGAVGLRQLQIAVAGGTATEIVAGRSWTGGSALRTHEAGLEYVGTAVRNLLRAKREQPVQYI
jgi:hypothetical protein